MRVLPDGTASIMINLGSPINIYGINGDYKGLQSNFLVGPQKKYYFLEETEKTFVVGIKFTLEGANTLIKGNMKDFSGKVKEINELVDWDTESLVKKIRNSESDGDIKRLLDHCIILHSDTVDGYLPVVNKAIKNIKEDYSPSLIKNICERENISNKHLISLFSRKVGVSPKLLQRLNKFTKVIYAVQNRKRYNWVDLAYEYNYYDQSHLINDFRNFSGLSPREYNRENSYGLRIISHH